MNFDDFFKPLNTKCLSCKIGKKKAGTIEESHAPSIVKKNGKGEILILLEIPEPKEMIDKLVKWLAFYRITNYTIANSFGCRNNKFEIPSPLNEGYGHCGMVSHEMLNQYKVIVPVGRAIHAVTGTDDINSWHEFMEHIFNDTFFYTPYEYNKKYKSMLRVYPIPKLIEFVKTDTFPEFFAKFQLLEATKWIKEGKTEVFKDAELIKVDNPSDFFEKTNHLTSFSWDTETSNLNVFADDFKVGCMTVSFDGDYGYYIPFDKINKRQLSVYFKDKKQTGANIKYDLKVMRRVGIANTYPDDDVNLLFHVLNTVKTKVGLKTSAWQVGYGGYDQPLEDYKKKNKITNYLDIPEPVMFPYATLDAVVTERVKRYLYKCGGKQKDLLKMYKEVLIPTIPIYTKAEMKGIKVNKNRIAKVTDYYDAKRTIAKEEAWRLAGEKFNVSSDDEVGRIFQKMGLPSLGLTKKKTYVTKEDNLMEWRALGYPIAQAITDYRKADHMINSFAGKIGEDKPGEEESDWFSKVFDASEDNEDIGLTKHIQSDGRVHVDFKFAMQDTFRSASVNPNFTNMPKRGDDGKIHRVIFEADPDFFIGEQDYAGLQLRITAVYSEDAKMSEIFTTGHGDPHSESAQAFFARDTSIEDFLKLKKEDPYKNWRDKAKGQVNFALIFSDDYYVLVKPIKQNWTEKEKTDYLTSISEDDYVYHHKTGDFLIDNTIAKYIFTKFFERYAGIFSYIQTCHETAIRQGYIDSIGGLRRHLPYLTYVPKNPYKDSQKIKGLKNVSVNTRAQNTEAWLVYRVLIKLNKKIEELGLKSWIVGTVHDAIVTMEHKDELEIMAKLKIECMDDYETFKIPLISEMSIGNVWGFGKEIKKEMTNQEILDSIEADWIKFKKQFKKNKDGSFMVHPIVGEEEKAA